MSRLHAPLPCRARSLGTFLCHHPPGLPYEDIDTISIAALKQDACLRAIIALKRAGKPIGPDPVEAFDAEPKLVMRAYRFAYRDALRLQLGRGRIASRRLARWQRRLSLDHGFVEMAGPRQEEALDAIIEAVVAETRLAMVQGMGLPNLTVKQTLRLIRLLRHLQRRKTEGTTVIPSRLRERLRLLRAASGLPLSTRDLYNMESAGTLGVSDCGSAVRQLCWRALRAGILRLRPQNDGGWASSKSSAGFGIKP